MRRNLWLRIGLVVGGHRRLASGYLYPPKKTINLGLDLQGGIHLVLGVDVDKALEVAGRAGGRHLKADAEKKGIGVTQIERRGATRARRSSSPRRRAGTTPRPCSSDFGHLRRQGGRPGGRARRPRPHGRRRSRQLRELAVRQGLETIRNRIDQFGVAEPSIQQQGDNRILVQLPGVQDPERAKALIGKTALLEFKLVDDRVDPEAALRSGPAAEGDELLYQRRVDKETKQERKIPYRRPEEGAAHRRRPRHRRACPSTRTPASPTCRSSSTRPGAKAFGDLTEANVGRRLAIVLDGNVHSAPRIRERIPVGPGRRSRAASPSEEATRPRHRAAGGRAARARADPRGAHGRARRSAPTRSARGSSPSAAAALAVVLFMLVYYRLSGLIADVALALNLLILMAAMAGFHATLTLPGIAGIVLTIGMAVDTNILIFERIREELRVGQDGARRDRRRASRARSGPSSTPTSPCSCRRPSSTSSAPGP